MARTSLRCIIASVALHVAISAPSVDTFTGLAVGSDGSYHAEALQGATWLNASCSAGGFRDFYIDSTDELAGDYNLHVRAVVVPTSGYNNEVFLEAINLFVYYKEIPMDRTSERVAVSSSTGQYSQTVNANDLIVGRYFLSVRCGEIRDVNFGIIADFVSAELRAGETAECAICKKEIMYHYVNISKYDGNHDGNNVRFTLCLPGDSLLSLTMVTRINHPPLRNAEPLVSLAVDYGNDDADNTVGADGVCITFDVCSDRLKPGSLWAGVFGAGICGTYNITAAYFDGVCEDEIGGTSADDKSTVVPLTLEHVKRAHCDAYQWVDFRFELDDYDRDNNLMFEVIDQSNGFNPEALSVHIFTNSIPTTRLTENRADRSTSRMFAVYKAFLNLEQMEQADGSTLDVLFVSVRCGAAPSHFRILGEHILAHLTSGHTNRGVVCTGIWVYHYFNIPSDAGASASLSVKLKGYEGAVDFVVDYGTIPVYITPPYGSTGLNNTGVDVLVCNLKAGSTYFVGVKLSTKSPTMCAIYDVNAVLDLNHVNCTTEDQAAPARGTTVLPLAPFNTEYNFVANGAHRIHSFDVTTNLIHSNLLFEVELTQTTTTADTPNALEVRLFQGSVPTDGEYSTERFNAIGKSGMWTIAVSAHDIKKGTYFIVVKGTDVNEVRYSIVVILLDASLELGYRHHGEVCNQKWAYFDYNAGSNNATAVSVNHRRRLNNLLEEKEQSKNNGGINSRSLLSATASNGHGTHGSTAVHLSVRVLRYSGSFYVRLTHGYAPIMLVPPYVHLDTDEIDTTMQLCNIGSHNGSVPETVFVGLLGSIGCARFDVEAYTYVGGNCTETTTFDAVDVTKGATELTLEHFTFGSCSAGGFSDFFLNLTVPHADNNIIFQVEQLGDASDMEALTVFLYQDAIPTDRRSELRSERSSRGIYSVAMSSVDTVPGLYFVSVQCKSAGVTSTGGGGLNRLRFRVAPMAIHRDLVIGKSLNGELCPLEWIHHRFELSDANLARMDDDGFVRRQLSSGEKRFNVRFHVWKYVGDFYIMISDSPPFKLMEPYRHVDHSLHEVTVDFCDVSASEAVWIGLSGGMDCSVYAISASVHTGTCSDGLHGRRLLASPDSSRQLSASASSSSSSLSKSSREAELQSLLSLNKIDQLLPGHLKLASCDPYEYVNFYLRVNSGSDIDPQTNNIGFEIIANQASQDNPNALSAFMHLKGNLPANKDDTEFFQLESTLGVLSLAVPKMVVETDTNAIFVSVRCGPQATRFKALAVIMHADLTLDKHSFGEVCPKHWVYFNIPSPEAAASGYNHVRFDVVKYEGAVSFKAQYEARPVRLTYPYVAANSPTGETTSVFVCNVASGAEVYFGARGGMSCSTFSVTPHYFNSATKDGCSQETNAVVSVNGQEDTTVALQVGAWRYGHCNRDGWAPISFHNSYSVREDASNYIYEVEMMSDDNGGEVLDPTAIETYLFQGAIPPPTAHREDYYVSVSKSAVNNVHTIIHNYIAVQQRLMLLKERNETDWDVTIAVKCSPARELVRFRTMVTMVTAALTFGHQSHGQVCPKAWVYQYADLRGKDDSGAMSSSSSHGRQLISNTKDDVPVNLRFILRILQGGIYQVSGRRGNPPSFNSINDVDLLLMAGPDPASTVATGSVVEYRIHLCSVAADKYFIGMFGDVSGCSLFDTTAELMGVDEKCKDGAVRFEASA